MLIIDLAPSDEGNIAQTAELLYASFRGRTAAWPDIASARAEVSASLAPGKVSRIAVDESGRVLGWIGGLPQYDGHAWEMHPLVVAEDVRRRGIGRALVEDIEAAAAARGALTLWLGSDDELGETSLANVNLYEDLPAKLAAFHSGGSIRTPFTIGLAFASSAYCPMQTGEASRTFFSRNASAHRRCKPAGL